MQSKHPCETISKHVLPALRSLIARELITDHGLTQNAAAKKLGITQAAISYYLSSKRGEKYIKPLEKDPHTRSIVREIADGLASRTLSSEEFKEKLCELCLALRKSEYITLK